MTGLLLFLDYLLYGEWNLVGERALVNMFQDVLALEYQEQPLSRYSVEWQIDEKHLWRVGNPRLYNHPYQSAQLELWPTGSVEWYVILRTEPYGPRPRRKKKRLVFFSSHCSKTALERKAHLPHISDFLPLAGC